MQIKVISSSEVLPLRHKILRPGLDRKEAIFSDDDLATTKHFAVVEAEIIIAVVTMRATTEVPEDLLFLDFKKNSWVQLRGMAVIESKQGKGVGNFLIRSIIDKNLLDPAYKAIWCNARTYALPFYQKLGFKEVGNEFETKVGPHFIMYKTI